jgi:hypothetical protein
MGQLSTVQIATDCTCDNAWCLLGHIYDKGGVGVISFLLTAFVFYRLVWKVWKAAMKAKDDEIERILDERNYFQSKRFPERRTSA